VGRLSKLHPEDDAYKALLVDEILGAVDDVLAAVVPTLYERDEEKKVRLAGKPSWAHG